MTVAKKRSTPVSCLSLFVCICLTFSAVLADNSSRSIIFDDVPGSTDTEKLLNLPPLIQSMIETVGTMHSLGGGWPQPGILNTAVPIYFSSRVHDFTDVAEPIDMGHCFSLIGQGRPIFMCGANGFIRFSQRRTIIQDIAFVGPRDNVPPLIIYSTGEPADWTPGGGRAEPGEPTAWGREVDGGDINIIRCYFKGFDVVLRTRPGQHTNSGYLRIDDSFFYNCVQLSDYLKIDWCVIESSWFCPTFESGKAFIVNHDELRLRDILAVPQSDVGLLQDIRWIDNYCHVDVRNSRFGNEYVNKHDPLTGEQVSLVYNYRRFGHTVTVTGEDGQEIVFDGDRSCVIIKDNVLYARNAPVIKFFEIPNHVIITGNTGLIGNFTRSGQPECDTSVMCAFDPNLVMPGPEMADYITFNIHDNNRSLRMTLDESDLLPEPLRYFGPRQRVFPSQED